MWFVFPQLAGLGYSAIAHHYAIRDLDQAKCYLADPRLGSRLREDVRLMMRHNGTSALEILGSPDDLEFPVLSDAVCASGFRYTLTARYSRRLSTSSMVARRILEHWELLCSTSPRNISS